MPADPAALSGCEATTDDRFAQVRLFELVLGVLDRLARQAPLVVIVEDLQWADPSTRDLLAFLVRNLRDEAVLLVASIRTDELEPRHEVMTFLAELERAERVDRIDLERLGRDDLERLLADELGRAPDRELADRIWQRSGGNPFYAEQLLAAARETGDEALPPRLRDVVLARLAAVSPDTQAVLRVAATAGPRIDDELLATVSERPLAAVRDALREAIDRRILVPGGGTLDPHVAFRHALLQEVIRGDLFPGERARLHGRFAEALEARIDDRAAGRPAGGPLPSAEELAYHWTAAGVERRALPVTIEAGVAAERVYAWQDAHRLYRTALVLWDRVEDPGATTSVDRTDLLVRAAETAVLTGAYRDAVALGAEAIAGIDPAIQPERAATLHERQRWYLWEAGDRAAAADALAEAERLVPARPAVVGSCPDPGPQGGHPAVQPAVHRIGGCRGRGRHHRQGGRRQGGRGPRPRHPRFGPGAARPGRRGDRAVQCRPGDRRGPRQHGGGCPRCHEPGDPARSRRPDERRA